MNRNIVITLSLLYVLLMGALSYYFYIHEQSFKSIVAIGGIVCGAVPLVLALFTKLQFHLPLISMYFIFLIGSQFLGSIMGLYGLGWWDTFMHSVSGAILAFAGIALYERLIHRNAGNHISPWFVFLFTLGFAALGGVLWEVYEFSSDQFFGMTLQGGGNKDTMTDLIADVAGGLVIAVVAGLRTRAKIKRV